MKKIFYLLSSAAVVCFFSCTKQHHHDLLGKVIIIDTTLTSGTEYTLDLKQYGDADDVATIKQQATTFTKSEITNLSNSFTPVYHFSADVNEKLLTVTLL